MYLTEYCPHCKIEHDVYFHDPEDGETNEVKCECGCQFDVTISVDTNISCIILPNDEFSIGAFDPNQLTLALDVS